MTGTEKKRRRKRRRGGGIVFLRRHVLPKNVDVKVELPMEKVDPSAGQEFLEFRLSRK